MISFTTFLKENFTNWKHDEPRRYAEHLSKTFGKPDEIGKDFVVWHNKDGFKRIVVKDEHILHGSPAPHYDFVYCYVDMHVDAKFDTALAESSKSILIDHLKNEVGARCHKITANAVTLNYVMDVVEGRTKPSLKEYESRILRMVKEFKSGKTWSVDWWPDESNDADPNNPFWK